MKKLYIALLLGGTSLMANAQYTFDVLKMSETELSGTSRYMSMAGAFGALGGDVSAISQNPGGIGVYRSSDISATMNLNFLSTKTAEDKLSDTKFWFNNVGYVGSMKIDNDFFRYFNWGFSFNRINSYQRRYKGGYEIVRSKNKNEIVPSLTNKIAEVLNAGNWTARDLSANQYVENIYYDEKCTAPWLGILAYQSYLINAKLDDGSLMGLFTDETDGHAGFLVDERGHTDEYNITLGGNFNNTVFWGLNFGITDLYFDSYQYYGEDLYNACITDYNINDHGEYDVTNNTTTGNAGFCLESYLKTRGTGYNFKMGVIVKPINQLRIGVAFHTPTYYDMKDQYKVYSVCELLPDRYENQYFRCENETGEYGVDDVYRYTIKTPWRFIGSLAVVPTSKGLISLDYEYVGANTMRCGNDRGYNYGDTEYKIKNQLQPSHVLRVGAEYRVTPNLSLRAGYSYQTSPVKDEVKNVASKDVDVVPSNYMYQYDNNQQYFTAGIGYRYKKFYADIAYVHHNRTSQYHAFPGEYHLSPDKPHLDLPENRIYGEEIKDNNNKVALTVGFRF